MELRLHPDVYEPAEDSYLLARAIEARGPYPGALTLDLGTGTGVAALALARAGARRVLAVDVNPHATRLARENARAAGLADRVEAMRGDLETAFAPGARFDVIAFNAPYLPTGEGEEVEGWLHHAFHGGEGGVEVAIRFLRTLPHRLAPGGRAFLVLSSRGESALVEAALQEEGLAATLAGKESFFFEEIRVWEIRRAAE